MEDAANVVIVGTFLHVSVHVYPHASSHVAVPFLDHVLPPPLSPEQPLRHPQSILSGPYGPTK